MRRTDRHRGLQERVLQALLAGTVILVVVLLFTEATPRGCVGPTVPVAQASPLLERRALPIRPELFPTSGEPEVTVSDRGPGEEGRDEAPREEGRDGTQPVGEARDGIAGNPRRRGAVTGEPAVAGVPTRLIKIDYKTQALRPHLKARVGFGTSVTELDDLDGDGIRELAVGAPGQWGREKGEGAVYVLFLDEDEEVTRVTRIGPEHLGVAGESAPGILFGMALCTVADLDLDLRRELAVGRLVHDGESAEATAEVWLLSLDDSGGVVVARQMQPPLPPIALDDAREVSSVLSLATPVGLRGMPTPSPSILVGLPSSGIGATVYALDGTGSSVPEDRFPPPPDPDGLEGFGRAVLSVSAPGQRETDLLVGFTDGREGGIARKAWSRSDGERLLIPAEELVRDRGFGSSLAWLGDRDEDGHPELAVGLVEDRRGLKARGGIWILSLDLDESRLFGARTLVPGEDGLEGRLHGGDLFGWSLARLTDRNGDGRADLAVGAPGDRRAGEVWLVLFGDPRVDRVLGELGYSGGR